MWKRGRRGSRRYDTRDLCLCDMLSAVVTGKVRAFFDGSYLCVIEHIHVLHLRRRKREAKSGKCTKV